MSTLSTMKLAYELSSVIVRSVVSTEPIFVVLTGEMVFTKME